MSESNILNNAELEEEILKAKVIRTENNVEGNRLKKFKNSLDSDEEDDEEEAKKYNVLDPEDFEGQEEATIDYDGDIRITPFNMKEELEEGHFDKDGTYIFHKDKNSIRDQWLDDIDWIKVKNVEGIKRKKNDSSDNESDADLPELDIIEHYKQMLEIMQPNETVQKSIRRLGGGKSVSRTASSRWKKKREEGSEQESKNPEDIDKDYEKLQQLTSLASDIIQTGDMDIYEQSYERLSFLVKTAKASTLPKEEKTDDADSALDMFGEDFDVTADAARKKKLEKKEENGQNNKSGSSSDVMWEFKWESKEDAAVYGPHPTSEMLRWVQEGYFSDGVWVREVGKIDAQFYSSKRIDFELYL